MSAHAGKNFVISREFAAPRELVWKVFTDPEHLRQWWGPKGFKVFHAKMDFRPGGSFHYGMSTPEGGTTIWGMMRYLEIAPPDRIVLISAFSDEHGGLGRHPLAPTWPPEMHSIFTFEDVGGKTRFTVNWRPHNATPEEQATFDAGHDSMRGGWGGTLDVLATYLAKFNN